jgi:hypothetical protein
MDDVPEAVRFLCKSSSCRELLVDGISLSPIRDLRLAELRDGVSCSATGPFPLRAVGNFPSCDSRRSRTGADVDSAFCRLESALGALGKPLLAEGPSGGLFSAG